MGINGPSRGFDMQDNWLLKLFRSIFRPSQQGSVSSSGGYDALDGRETEQTMGIVLAVDHAERRTKNRCRDHTLVEAEITAHSFQIPGHIGIECVLVECTDASCDWRGWLPTRDVRVDDDKG